MTLSNDCAIWLYGSQARGDADLQSDVDVLVVSDCVWEPDEIMSVVAYSPRLSITQYTWREIERMAGYGSLFLRHLHLEGQVLREGSIVQGRLNEILSPLPAYSLATRDLMGFYTVLEDVRGSFSSATHLMFELATLATVFRHACILGCAVSDRPCFARFAPISQLVRRWGLKSSWSEEFPSLYAYRMYADGRARRPANPNETLARVWCDRTEILLDELQERLNVSH